MSKGIYDHKRCVTTKIVRDLIESNGGRVANNFEHLGGRNKVMVRCKEGHIFKISWDSIRQGHWCNKCAKERKRFNAEKKLRKVINKKRAVLQKDFKYENSYTKFEVRCKKGHIWKTYWAIIRQGSWCPECSGFKRVTSKDVRKFIESKDCKIVENFRYSGNIRNMIPIRCKEGHVFHASLINLYRYFRCPTCEQIEKENKFNSKVARIVNDKGGKIEGDLKCNSSLSRFWVICDKGHRWKSSYNLITQGCWCHKCFFLKERVDEKEVRELIKSKGGIIQEDFNYEGGGNKFLIKDCGRGHQFKTNWNYLRKGCWCSICQNAKEHEFRKVMEKIFNDGFPKCRPVWLKWEKDRSLELDGYNKNLKIAFEYQGYQHYAPAHYDGYSLKEFKERKRRDKFKIRKCRENHVLLIIVPHYYLESKWESLVKSSYIKWRNHEEIK